MKIFIIIIVVGILCWIAWSYFSSNVEQLKYTVVEKKEKYEIRKYEKYIEAKVEVDGLGRQALGDGFRILANYIFGGNLGNKQVAMTAPVLVGQKLDGEKVAMTAPVLAKEEGGKTEVVFSMPSKYKLEDLPKTNDKRISFKVVDGKKIATYRFTWYYTEEIINQKKKEFLQILNKENKKIVGQPIFAGYNAPGTIPFMMRNEILVEIE